MSLQDAFGAKATLSTQQGDVTIYRLSALKEQGIGNVDRLPFSLKVLLETLLRNVDGLQVSKEDVEKLANWNAQSPAADAIPFKPGRVVLQDFTGVPAVVDLAALRDALAKAGGDPKKINPLIPCDLVVDHSVQVDAFGSDSALAQNAEREFERNQERYEFLRWGSKAFTNFRLVPPATGIVHQVNLEYLAQVVMTQEVEGEQVAFPDSLVGTDSHTTMINGLGVLGWGVGGIEAEAAMLGQPLLMLPPAVIGFELTGALPEGATATDLVLTVTEMLREKGVVGKFVEFYGSGLSSLPLPDRATISNMCPEYGATASFFPVDEETLNYMRLSGRPEALIDLVEKYTKEQGLFRTDDTPQPEFTETVSLDMSTVKPSLAGPKRPQDRITLSDAKSSFAQTLSQLKPEAHVNGTESVGNGSVVIAAITSCTNTSNPSVMVGAGLVAKKAVEKGLQVKPHVKTSLAPGSQVVTEYLDRAGLTEYFNQLGFHTVGYGCTTCIGNSGPLPEPVAGAIKEKDLVVASVLSGNRNFEGRVHQLVKTNYLASPMLVVAYALAGSMGVDLETDALGQDAEGNDVFLKDIWPTQAEIAEAITGAVTQEAFNTRYADVFKGPEAWQAIAAPDGDLYEWKEASTYIQHPPFFQGMTKDAPDITPIADARVLVKVGDSVTTDHISPAGAIAPESPAGAFLSEKGIEQSAFNSYGSRRGNDRIMVRGTFANIRLKNQMAPGTEGWWTTHVPTGEQVSIYEASERYKADGTPSIVLAGKEYGSGSSRDWAAKGPSLLGIRAVIAESFERIHRSNLVGMGILPLQFKEGESPESLGLTGQEAFTIQGLDNDLKPRTTLTVKAVNAEGHETLFEVLSRIDVPVEVEYFRHGGILSYVLRRFID